MVTVSRNRAEAAYQQIREGLLDGRWKTGEVLSTYSLADELKVSRTTVMAALKRLEAECYIEIVPQVGCIVRGVTSREVHDLFLVRSAIEGIAAELAAQRISESTLQTLQANIERSAEAVARGDAERFQQLNRDFHATIVYAAGISLLNTTLATLWHRKEYEPSNVTFFQTRMARSLAEHRAIIQCLCARDAVGARAAVEAHIRGSSQEFVNKLPGES